MEHFLWKSVISRYPKAPISEDDYLSIVFSKKMVSSAIQIEHLWQAILENFFEFEKHMIEVALEQIVYRPTHSHEAYRHRQTSSRLLANCLSSCRAYLDQTPGWLGQVEFSEPREEFRTNRSDVYDASFHYRFMEALRNFVQHRGAAVDSYAYKSQVVSPRETSNGERKIRQSAKPILKLQGLKEDVAFKREVLEEFEENDEQVDLIEYTRRYMEGLGVVHERLRASIADELNSAISFLRDQIRRYGALNNGDVVGLEAAKFEDDRYIEGEDIFEEMLSWCERLRRRNGTFKHLTAYYVSSEGSI